MRCIGAVWLRKVNEPSFIAFIRPTTEHHNRCNLCMHQLMQHRWYPEGHQQRTSPTSLSSRHHSIALHEITSHGTVSRAELPAMIGIATLCRHSAVNTIPTKTKQSIIRHVQRGCSTEVEQTLELENRHHVRCVWKHRYAKLSRKSKRYGQPDQDLSSRPFPIASSAGCLANPRHNTQNTSMAARYRARRPS